VLGLARRGHPAVQIPCCGLDLVERAEEDEKWRDAVVAALEGHNDAAARVTLRATRMILWRGTALIEDS